VLAIRLTCVFHDKFVIVVEGNRTRFWLIATEGSNLFSSNSEVKQMRDKCIEIKM
jgi:hypothetical protein